MSVGPMGGVTGSAAGAPLSQTAGSETERASKDVSAGKRVTDSQERSEKASGIGQTEQDQEASERDADGRRLWEAPPEGNNEGEDQTEETGAAQRKSKDPTGNCGNRLDLTG
jgi:hypothetical protein